MGIIILIAIVIIAWCVIKDSETTTCGSLDEFKKEASYMWELALNYCECMEHYIDPAVCNFTIGFDKKGTYMMFSMMVRDTFNREFRGDLSVDNLLSVRLSFHGDKNQMREFLKMASASQQSELFVSHYCDFKTRYRQEECAKWFSEYIKKNYYKHQVKSTNGEIKVAISL